jgi:hypothetical protein
MIPKTELNKRASDMSKYTSVRIVKDAFLPRFNFNVGEIWTVRTEKITALGFPVGGGFIESSYYEIIR